MSNSRYDQCCLCGHASINATIFDSRKLKFVKGLMKLCEGLKSSDIEGDKLCKRCQDDVEYVHQFLLRITKGRQQEQQQIMSPPLSMDMCDVEQHSHIVEQTIVSEPPRKEISEEKVPAKRLRRPPKRFLDDETYQLKPKLVTHFVYPKKTQKSTLDNFPKVAHIRSSSGPIIGDLIEIENNGKHSRIRILCRNCAEVFANEKSFRNHAATHGKENDESLLPSGEIYAPPESFSYLCSICEKRFEEHFAVRRHFKTSHNKERPLQCDQCPATFKYKCNLNYHLARHMNSKPHQCPQCEKKFVLRYELLIHVRIHTGEKPFKCQTCSASFAHRSNLIVHRQSHKHHCNVQCSQCKASFKTLVYLRRHELRVHKNVKANVETNCSDTSFKHSTIGNTSDCFEANTFVPNVEKHLDLNSAAAAKIDATLPNATNSFSMALDQVDNLLPKQPNIPPTNIGNMPRGALLPKHFKIIKIPKSKVNMSLTQSPSVGNYPNVVINTTEENFAASNTKGIIWMNPLHNINNINASCSPLLTKEDNPCSEAVISNNQFDNSGSRVISHISQMPLNVHQLGMTRTKIKTVPSTLPKQEFVKIVPRNTSNCSTKAGQLEKSFILPNIHVTADEDMIGFDSHTANSSQNISFSKNSQNQYHLISTNSQAETALAPHCSNTEVNSEISTIKPQHKEVSVKEVLNKPSGSETMTSTNPVVLAKTSILKVNCSPLLKTPIQFNMSPYSVLKKHIENPPSPSKPRITRVATLPPLNVERMQIPSTHEPLPSMPASVVKKSTEYKFQCCRCWKYFKHKSALNKHARTHTGQKPYKCNLCPKAYADASNYKKHKLLHTKAADALNISRPKPPASPASSTASDPDPDGIEAMQTIQRFELSSSDEDDLWQDALQHSLMNEEIRENIKRNLMAINSAIMPAEQAGDEVLGNNLLSANYYSSENPD